MEERMSILFLFFEIFSSSTNEILASPEKRISSSLSFQLVQIRATSATCKTALTKAIISSISKMRATFNQRNECKNSFCDYPMPCFPSSRG